MKKNLLPTPSTTDTFTENLKSSQQKDTSKHSVNLPQIFNHPYYSQGDFPVKDSPRPARGGEKVMTAFFGQRCLSASGCSNPHRSLRKMFTGSLILRGNWSSNRCALTWKRKVTRFGRSLFQLVPSTLRIEGIGCGLSPTPQASDWVEGARTAKDSKQACIGRELNKMLTTPNSQDSREVPADMRPSRYATGRKTDYLSRQIAMLPTPTIDITHDYCLTGLIRPSVGKKRGHSLGSKVGVEIGTKTGRKLRLEPAFVEWMMGFPQGFTDLNCQKLGTGLKGSKPSETQ